MNGEERARRGQPLVNASGQNQNERAKKKPLVITRIQLKKKIETIPETNIDIMKWSYSNY